MNILTVVHSLSKGGTQRAAQNFALGYAALGHDSRVFYTREDGLRRGELQKAGVPVCMLSASPRPGMWSDWSPDVVHVHSHGLRPHEFKWLQAQSPAARFIETNVFSRPSPWADHLTGSFQLSNWCKALYALRSGGESPSTVIPYPVQTSAFAPAGRERVAAFRQAHGIGERDLVIGRIGQAYDSKWSRTLLEDFDHVRSGRPDVKLLLVNPPRSIIGRAARSPWAKDVVILDSIQGDRGLCDAYSAMDVFYLVADQGESFGMVLAESLLCETPVLTLATPWLDNSQGEVVGHGIGGWVAARRHSLPSLLKRMLDDSALRARMGEQGRKSILQRYDHIATCRKALQWLETEADGERDPVDLACLLQGESDGALDALSRAILRDHPGYRGLLRFTTGYDTPFSILQTLYHRIIEKRMYRAIERDE